MVNFCDDHLSIDFFNLKLSIFRKIIEIGGWFMLLSSVQYCLKNCIMPGSFLFEQIMILFPSIRYYKSKIPPHVRISIALF